MKRDVFAEITEGFEALAAVRQRKVAVRSHERAEPSPQPCHAGLDPASMVPEPTPPAETD